MSRSGPRREHELAVEDLGDHVLRRVEHVLVCRASFARALAFHEVSIANRSDAERARFRTMYRLLYWLGLSRLPAEGTHRVSFALLRALVAVPGMRGLLARVCAPSDPRLR